MCGGGANGGDGRIVARVLVEAGQARCARRREGGETELGEPHVIVDAIFGTGFSGEPRAEAASLIERINASGAPRARHRPAVGRRRLDRRGRRRGRQRRRDRHLSRAEGRARRRARAASTPDACTSPTSGSSTRETARARDARSSCASVPRRREGDNKYTAGHVLVVGGSRGLTGAPSLAAQAAMRADAGYVTVAAPESTLPVLEQRLLEAVKRPLPDEDGLVAEGSAEIVRELAQKATAVALGPGLGRGAGAAGARRALLARARAAGRGRRGRALPARAGDWPGPRVLTPHEGELGAAARTRRRRRSPRTGSRPCARRRSASTASSCSRAPTRSSPRRAAGARRLPLGLPSLATAGTGDVLTGIVGAFLAKGMDAQLAAAAAAVAQQRASVEAPQRFGLVASDLIDALPRVLALDASVGADDRPRCSAP